MGSEKGRGPVDRSDTAGFFPFAVPFAKKRFFFVWRLFLLESRLETIYNRELFPKHRDALL